MVFFARSISNLNLYPPDIFSLLRALVIESGQDPTPLDGVVALGGLTYVKTTATSAATSRKRSLSDSSFDPEQEYADNLVAPSKPGVNPGSEMFEHMMSPQWQIEEEDVSGEGMNESAEREAMVNDMFAPNTTGAGNGLSKRSLVKRGIYTGYVAFMPAFAFAILLITEATANAL